VLEQLNRVTGLPGRLRGRGDDDAVIDLRSRERWGRHRRAAPAGRPLSGRGWRALHPRSERPPWVVDANREAPCDASATW